MELRQLRHLLEVVRTASFRRAADNLLLTQPALSKSIKKLEEHLGAELLERGPNGAVATPYGLIVAEYAQSIEAEVERVRSEIAGMKGSGNGSVRIGISTSLLRFLLADILRTMMDKFPRITVRIVEGLQTELLAALRQGTVDVVICGGESPLDNPEFLQKPLCRVHIGVVCASGHPLAKSGQASLLELSRYRWILPDLGEQEEIRLRNTMAKAGLPAPAIAIRVSSSLAMAALLQGTSLVSYLPLEFMRSDPAYQNICTLDCPAAGAEARIMMTYRRRAVLLPAAKMFITEMQSMAQVLDRTTG